MTTYFAQKMIFTYFCKQYQKGKHNHSNSMEKKKYTGPVTEQHKIEMPVLLDGTTTTPVGGGGSGDAPPGGWGPAQAPSNDYWDDDQDPQWEDDY